MSATELDRLIADLEREASRLRDASTQAYKSGLPETGGHQLGWHEGIAYAIARLIELRGDA